MKLIASVIIILAGSVGIGLGAQSVTPTPSPASQTPRSLVTLTGVVRDPDGTPLSAVEVVVDSTYRDFTNERGEFKLSGLRAGLLELTARRVGYHPISTIVQVDSGLVVQLAIKLIPNAAELETVVVEGKRLNRTLVENGYYERQKLGAGYFMDPDYLARHSTGISSLVRTIPSVQVSRTRRGAEVALGRNGHRLCAMSIFVDGTYFRMGGELGVDEAINRDDLLALEVYPHATDIPTKYLGSGMSGFDCGAIMIWTKPFAPKGKKN